MFLVALSFEYPVEASQVPWENLEKREKIEQEASRVTARSFFRRTAMGQGAWDEHDVRRTTSARITDITEEEGTTQDSQPGGPTVQKEKKSHFGLSRKEAQEEED